MVRFLAAVALFLVLVLAASSCNPSAAQPTAKPAAATLAPVATPAPVATTKPAPIATKAPAALLTPDAQHPIVVGEPKAQQSVKSTVRISGLAQVFEGTVHAEIVDSKGNVVGKGYTTASAGGPEVGSFSFDVTFTPPAKDEPATVRVFSPSPRDGSRVGMVEVPVTLAAR